MLQQQLTISIEKQGIRPYSLISGAGHDAMNIAEIAPIGMLFVRSKDGISHNPLEYSSDEDIIVATNIFMIQLLNLLNRLLYRRKPFLDLPCQVDSFKRLSSHLVSIFYRCQVVESFWRWKL